MAHLNSIHLKVTELSKLRLNSLVCSDRILELLLVTVSHLASWLSFRLYIVSVSACQFFCKTLKITLFIDDISCQLQASL